MKRKGLVCLAESVFNWQEENPQFLHKIGGRDPQFFPQDRVRYSGELIAYQALARLALSVRDERSRKTGPFYLLISPN
jgi:hypothetical protein